MAVTQYIGARYVPKFYENANLTAEWEPNVIYEPLMIVTRNGNSYTSRKNVPASVGAPEFNPEYWVATGLYNDQITTLTNRVDYRVMQKFIFLGASISLSTTSTLAGGFVDKAINALGLSADDYFNIAYNGAGFSSGTTFTQQLQTAAATVSEEFKGCYVRIIIVGGTWNDSDQSATFLDDVDSFVAYAKSEFPNSSLEFVPLSWSKNATKRVKIKEFTETYIKQLPDHGISVWWDYYAYMHNYVDWYRDDIHWSQTGIDIMARMFQNVIRNVGDADMNPNEGLLEPITPFTNLDAGLVQGQVNYIREYYDGRFIYIKGGGFMLCTPSDSPGLVVPTSLGAPLQAFDNPFHYLGTANIDLANAFKSQWAGVPCYLRDHAAANSSFGGMFVNRSDKLCFWALDSFTLTNGSNTVRFLDIAVPRELC